MHDFSCTEPDKMYNKDIADITRYYKETQKGVNAMCKVMDELRNETRLSDLKNIIEEFAITSEQAMDVLKIPEEDREKFRKEL